MRKIHIYNRHYTRNKTHPQRTEWFDYEKTFGNLLATTNFDLCNLTVIFEREEDYDSYFVKKYEGIKPFKIKFIDTSKEKWIGKTNEDAGWSRGIAAATQVIYKDNLPKEDLLYMVDDDYIHTPYWVEKSLDYINNFIEGDNFALCPCDCADKYYFIDKKHTIDRYGTDLGMYSDLLSKIRVSNHCYWREVINCLLFSSIMPVTTFYRDYEEYWSRGWSDCAMCGELKKKYNMEFWTPMSSISCHSIDPFCPPFINWKSVMENIRIKI